MKKTPVILVFSLLLVLFCFGLFVYPKVGLESTNRGYEYMDTVFDQSKVTSVDIKLDDKDLTTMLANASDEEIVEANVTINGTTVNHVGLRTKGNLSLRSVVQMDDSERYSFKIDFDYYDSTQSLDGLKKLNLNNNYSDASQMREFMSYKMMDGLGIATPGYSYMYVTINGEEWGLYLGVEAIEETFLARSFDKGSDSLYKPDGTGSDLKYISNDYNDYTGIGAKTDISRQDEDEFMDFINAINAENSDLETVLDVDEMLRYFTANTALVNLDSYQGNLKHNYYLYEEDGIFSVLPWDYNMAFGGFGAGMGGGGGKDGFPGREDAAAGNVGNAVAPTINDAQTERQNNMAPANANSGAAQSDARQPMGMMVGNALSDSTINLSIYEPVSGTTMEERPLINALLSNEGNVALYEKYVSEIATSFLAKENFTQMVDEVYTLIHPYVEKDPTAFYTVDEFEEDVHGDNGIIEFASKRSDSILAQLSGELVVENTNSNTSAPSTDGAANKNSNDNAVDGAQSHNRGEMPEGMQHPNGEGMPEGMQHPNGEGMRGGQGGPGFGENGTIGTQSTGYSKTMIITSAVSVVLLVLLTFATSRFKRRRE
ncbi:hypothetical protein PB01_18680 [Psychrobacillus glaciei]|uniref:Spore coat protein CotH n=1 Tax=Psychrobacillus glaciei TaxID=2283160 RepID=A0A5J6SUF9_9BACI|nr:CotH kinase family protein [Psychrobacillus glaciei]QFG00655.1 hypothetical protein PB01_18680 [Psychrobacillus glaciei]